LLLLTAGNYEVRGWIGLQWHNVHTKFGENLPVSQKIKGETHKQHNDFMGILSFRLVKESRQKNNHLTVIKFDF
jgi:hypothetical protein